MMIFLLLIIALYTSKNEVHESLRTNVKLYTQVQLTNDYPWLFGDHNEQPRTGEEIITIENCQLESKELLWPAKELFILHLHSISLKNPFDLSPIPLVQHLFLQSLDHNPAAVLKLCKFPPAIIELYFDKDAVRFIKFIQADRFAVNVERIQIHLDTFQSLLDYEREKIMKKLGQLLNINHIEMKNSMIQLHGFLMLNVKIVAHGKPSAKKRSVPKAATNLKLYNGEQMKNEYPWLYDNTRAKTMDPLDKQISISDCKMESAFIVWPPNRAISSLHLTFVELIDPFDLSAILWVENLTLQALDFNSAGILRKCKFPQRISTLYFADEAVLMIKFIEQTNFAGTIEYIKIHKPTMDNLHAEEQKKK